MQTKLQLTDLETILALARGGTLANAAQRLHVDSSTVFRNLKRIEKQLGSAAFTRSRAGYVATELGQALARHAEIIESELEAARAEAACQSFGLEGSVSVTSTDLILNALVIPALAPLRQQHPRLTLELLASNDLANLSKRDADIAVRATRKPPQHLVGRKLGPLRYQLFVNPALMHSPDVAPDQLPWVAPDDLLPEHPSIAWRRKHFPKAQVSYKASSVLSLLHAAESGLGVAVLPALFASQSPRLMALSEPLDDCTGEIWLLTHPDTRHLHRIKAVFDRLAEGIMLT